MSNIDEIPDEAGNVNWDKLEGKKSDDKPKKKKVIDLEEEVQEEMKNLTADEKSMLYPDEFLADINFMRKDLGVGDYDISHLKEDPKKDDE
ncbi:MAG: hypothetical protein ACPGJS_00080 [Flammeovirgaceae bacterium]